MLRFALPLLGMLALNTTAFAQSDLTTAPLASPFRAPSSTAAPKKLGWAKTLNLSGNLSFSSSQDVIGQTDGNSQTYGLNVKGGLDRVSESDEWRNTLIIMEATSRTPSLPTFIKASDEARLETSYLYSLPSVPQIGPYVNGLVTAPIFSGQDVRAAPTTYLISRKGQADQTVTTNTLHLTDGFKPLTTKESIGGFWKAVDDTRLHVEVRVGLAAQQISASEQLTVGSANAAGQLPVTELSDINQAGLELAAGVKGLISDNSSYEAYVSSLTPFINNKASDDTRSAVSLTDVEGGVKLTSKINSWSSFGYDYKLKIQPQLIERPQQIHLLTLNVNYNLF